MKIHRWSIPVDGGGTSEVVATLGLMYDKYNFKRGK